jgi:thioredoxin reductase
MHEHEPRSDSGESPAQAPAEEPLGAGIDGSLTSAVIRDSRTGERHELGARAVFLFIGASPHTVWLRGAVAMDEDGFLLTGHDVQETTTPHTVQSSPTSWRQASPASSP